MRFDNWHAAIGNQKSSHLILITLQRVLPEIQILEIHARATRHARQRVFGEANVHSNVTVTHGGLPDHSTVFRAATVSWTAGSNRFFQINWRPINTGFDFTTSQFMNVRVERAKDDALNTTPSTNFNVQLVNGNGTLSSAIAINPFAILEGPVGNETVHTMLQTARLRLSNFTGATLNSIRGIRFTFSSTPTGKIYIGNIFTSRDGSLPGSAALALAPSSSTTLSASTASTAAFTQSTSAALPQQRITSGNSMTSLRSKGTSHVTLTVTTSTPFPVRNEVFLLRVGNETGVFTRGAGDQRSATFTLTRAAYDRLRGGELVRAGFGDDPTWRVEWSFGPIDKARLDR